MKNKQKINEEEIIGESIKETAIQQMLDGLKRMPMLLSRVEQMIDDVSKEAVRRFKANQ